MNTIRIACKGAATMPLEKLIHFQGDLKTLMKRDYKRLRKEILELGFISPVYIWKNKGKALIIDGHQRCRVLAEMKKTEGAKVPRLPVVWVEAKTEKLARRMVLAMNSQYGKMESQGLYEFMDKAAIDIDEAIASFRLPEIDYKKFQAEYYENQNFGEQDAPDKPAKARTKKGQIWEMGKHRIMCGNSKLRVDVLKLMDGATADFIFTSPPYNVGVEYKSHDDKTVSARDYLSFLKAVLLTTRKVLGKGRAIAWNIGVSPMVHPLKQFSILEDFGLEYFRMFIWQKMGVPVPSWFHTLRDPKARRLTSNMQFEFVGLFTNGAPELGAEVKIDDTLENDVFRISQTQATKGIPKQKGKHTGTQSGLTNRAQTAHPAPFPVKLPQSFIQHMTGPGEIVYDPFCGSGSTIIAAENLGRRGFGMEIEPAYVDVVVQRWQEITKKKAVLVK